MPSPQANQPEQLPADFKTCDTCKWGEPEKDGSIACFGVPPTPVLIGAKPDNFGRVQMAVELLRPKLKKGTRACRLHESKIQILSR